MEPVKTHRIAVRTVERRIAEEKGRETQRPFLGRKFNLPENVKNYRADLRDLKVGMHNLKAPGEGLLLPAQHGHGAYVVSCCIVFAGAEPHDLTVKPADYRVKIPCGKVGLQH